MLNRKTIIENLNYLSSIISEMRDEKRDEQHDKDNNILNLFTSDEISSKRSFKQLKKTIEYNNFEKLQAEFDALGFYLSQHPLENYQAMLNEYNIISSGEIENLTIEDSAKNNNTFYSKELNFIMCGVVTKVIQRFKKTGRFAFIFLSDLDGIYETMVFKDELISKHRDKLVDGRQLIIFVSIRNTGGSKRISIWNIFDIEDFTANGKTIIAQNADKFTNKNKTQNIDNKISNNDNKIEKTVKTIVENVENIQITISSKEDIDKLKNDIDRNIYNRNQKILMIFNNNKFVVKN